MRMTKERGMPSHCPYASNPCHVCGKYCSHKPAIDKDLVAVQNDQCNDFCVRETPNKKVSAKVAESGSTPNDVIEKDIGVNDERLRRVDPLCVHASNPYHKCSHYCARRDCGEKVLPEGAKSVWGSNMMEAGRGAIFPLSASDGRKEKVLNANNLNSSCPYASNPYHQCEKYCSQRTTQDTPGRKEKVLNVNVSNVNSSCPYASNPYHQCQIYCSQRTKQDTPESNMGIRVIQRKNASPTCKYALNPYHKCDSHCSMKFNTVH